MALRALARDEVDNPHDDFRQPFFCFFFLNVANACIYKIARNCVQICIYVTGVFTENVICRKPRRKCITLRAQVAGTLLFAMDLAELQDIFKKKVGTEKCLKYPTFAIFFKSWGFKDVKYDIPMCQYHSTRPQPFQLVPTMQKKALYVIISVQIPEN